MGRISGRLKHVKMSQPFLQYNFCKLLKQKIHKDAGHTKGGTETNSEWYLNILAGQFLESGAECSRHQK